MDGYLDTKVTAQIEIKLIWMRYSTVHCCSRRYVPGFPSFISRVFTKQPRVVSLLNHNKRDPGTIFFLKLHASLLNSTNFVSKDLIKLAFADSIPIKNDFRRLEFAISLVELNQKLFYNHGQVIDDFLGSMPLLVPLCAHSRRSDLPFLTQERSQEGEKHAFVYTWVEYYLQPNTVGRYWAWADHYLSAVICKSRGGLLAKKKEEEFVSNDNGHYRTRGKVWQSRHRNRKNND